MEPLNKKERTSFIVKFAASFILGIFILLIPFYFLIRLPDYENAILSKDVKKMQEIMIKQKEIFAVQVDSVKKMFIKYDLPRQDIEILNAQMGSFLNKMEEPYIKDTTWNGKMINSTIQLFIDLKKAKNDKIKSDNNLIECQKNLEKANAEGTKSKDTM